MRGIGHHFGYRMVNTLKDLVINYTFGTTTIPSTVKAASMLLMSWMWQKRNQRIGSKGAQSFSFAGRSVNWGSLQTMGDFQSVNSEIGQLLRLKSRILVG